MPDLEIFRPRKETWLQRAVRAITLGPFNAKDPAIARMFGGASASAGVRVNEQTAMNYSAVWAAVTLISQDIAKVPLVLYRLDADGGKHRYKSHALYRLIHDRPNPQMSGGVFRRTLQAHKLIWGNGYAEIERDNGGRPVALWPLMPYAVEPVIQGGVLRYRVHNPSSPAVMFDASDIVHIRGVGGDGTCGMSVIPCARESLGLGLAAERFGATFFGNGSTFGGVISYPPGVGGNPQTRKDNRDAIEKVHTGVDRAHRFLALYEGAKYETLGVPPNAAQFLETREFQIEEVCRWFNVPPHKLKHLKRSTNNNIEHQGIEYVTDTLDPHWVDWEQELMMKLVPPLERNQQLIEHVREGVLRGDSQARGELYSKMFSIAAITPNEIRARENLNPIKGGDTVYVPLNTLPLDRLEEYYDAIIDEKKAKAEPPPPPPVPVAPPAGATEDEKKAWDAAITEARKRAQQAEDAADLAKELAAKERNSLTADVAALTADVAAMTQARDWFALDAHEARTALDVAVQEVGVLKVRSEQAEESASALAAESNSRAERLCAETEARTQAEAGRDTAVTERDAAEARAVAAEQSRDDVREFHEKALASSVAASLEADARADRLQAQAKDLCEKQDALQAEADTLRTDLATARQEIAAELTRARAHRTRMLAEMRALFVDASSRLLAKESNAARKQQATGQKLGAWVDRFYPLHEDTVREVFRPLTGPWTALTGGDPGELLDRLVMDHLNTSIAPLRLAADEENADERAAMLERALTRWERERAESMADALLREGMAS